MRLYIQRSLQAKYKVGTDYLFAEIEKEAVKKGVANLTNIKRQYDVYYRESNVTATKLSGSYNIVGFPGSSTNQTVNRTGWEKTNSVLDAD